MLGLTPPGLLTLDDLYQQLGPTRRAAQRAYLELTETLAEDRPVDRHPIVHGDKTFTSEQLQRINPSPDHPRRDLRPTPPPLATLISNPADTAGIAAARANGYTLHRIATHLGLHTSTISRRLNATNKT